MHMALHVRRDSPANYKYFVQKTEPVYTPFLIKVWRFAVARRFAHNSGGNHISAIFFICIRDFYLTLRLII